MREIDIDMNKPTAFSLVELLVVISIIAIIAAIAIPNIAGIAQNAQNSTDRRNAQNLSSLSMAAIAAGAKRQNLGNSMHEVIATLTNGLIMTNGTLPNMIFRVDGLSPTATGYTNYLSYVTNTGGLLYNPSSVVP